VASRCPKFFWVICNLFKSQQTQLIVKVGKIMFVHKYLRKTLISSVIGFAVLFPAASHAQMLELAKPLIKWSAGKIMGGVLMKAGGMGLDSVLGSDQPLSGATPAQVEEIMQRVLREQITQQTRDLENFIIKNNFTQLEDKRRTLDEAFRSYNSIQTGYQDRLTAIIKIRDIIDDIMGSIKASLQNEQRRTKVPQLFFSLYSMHNALIPLRVAAQAEVVLTSNRLYESGQTTGRAISDGVELVYAARNALADSRDFWEHYYPGHLNAAGTVAVATDKCIPAHPSTKIKSITGEDLAGGTVYSPMGPGNLNNMLSDLQPQNNSLSNTMNRMGLPTALGLAGHVAGSRGNQWLVGAICYNDLAMRYSRAFDIGFGPAVTNGTIYKWFSPQYTSLRIEGRNSSYGSTLAGADYDLNHNKERRVWIYHDPCTSQWGFMGMGQTKDVGTLLNECKFNHRSIANIASFTSVNYWKPVRNHLIENIGVFVAPHESRENKAYDGLAYSVDMTSVPSQQRQTVLNNLQVKAVSNAYDKRFGSNNEKDVVKNTHSALLEIIDEYIQSRANRGEYIDTRITNMRKDALSNYQYMHCPEKNKYQTWYHITASQYEELFGHPELYCQS
jgi:hypothetical protein